MAAQCSRASRVVDGRTVNGSFWAFYGALSDVGYEIRMRDTVTGSLARFVNPEKRLRGASDIEAFPAPP